MDRVLRGTPATISVTFYQDGTIVDPGTVTIGITRDDGTALVAAGADTSGTGAAARTYTLTTTHTALLDNLTATWTSPTKGTLTTYIEVVGGFLFSVADARALSPLENTTTYTTARIIQARTLAEQTLEHECGVAFVPRYGRETINGDGGYYALLRRPRVRSIRSLVLEGTTQDATRVEFDEGGRIYHPSGWRRGFRNYLVRYEHGYDRPDARVSNAALQLAKRYLVDSPVDDRMTSMTTGDGTFSLVTAGVRGAPTDLPEVNAVIASYNEHPAFA